MKLVGMCYYLVTCTNHNLLISFLYFQTLICKDLLVLFSFFFLPLKKACLSIEILGKFVQIYFLNYSFVYLFIILAVKISLPFYILQNTALPRPFASLKSPHFARFFKACLTSNTQHCPKGGRDYLKKQRS